MSRLLNVTFRLTYVLHLFWKKITRSGLSSLSLSRVQFWIVYIASMKIKHNKETQSQLGVNVSPRLYINKILSRRNSLNKEYLSHSQLRNLIFTKAWNINYVILNILWLVKCTKHIRDAELCMLPSKTALLCMIHFLRNVNKLYNIIRVSLLLLMLQSEIGLNYLYCWKQYLIFDMNLVEVT